MIDIPRLQWESAPWHVIGIPRSFTKNEAEENWLFYEPLTTDVCSVDGHDVLTVCLSKSGVLVLHMEQDPKDAIWIRADDTYNWPEYEKFFVLDQ